MALSAVEVLYNLALGLLGEDVVTEGGTTTKQYGLCSRYYASARDEVLVSHPWNEAIVRAEIVQDATNPIFGFDRRFGKPSGALKILSVDNEIGADRRFNAQGVNVWEVEGEYILSNAGITPPTWATDTDYIDGQFFTSDSVTYEVLVTHTSDTIANDLVSEYIESKSGDYKIVYVTYITQLTDTTKFSTKLMEAVAMRLAIKIATAITGDPKVKKGLITEYERLVMPQARSVDAQQGTPKPIFNSAWIRSRY
jgi:hypothetical protein